MATIPNIKFQKSHDFRNGALVYIVHLPGDDRWGSAHVYRDGSGWKIEDYASGEDYAARTRRDAVAAMLAAREVEADRQQLKAQYDRMWEKIWEANERKTCTWLTTAEHCMLGAEENADDTSQEMGFARHSRDWYSYAVASQLDALYGEYGDLAYITNIDEDINDGKLDIR